MTYYKKGAHNFECDVCKEWHKSDKKRIRWDKMVVCPDCNDPRPWFLNKIPAVMDMRPVTNPRLPSNAIYADGSTDTGILWEDDHILWDGDNTLPGLGEWEN
jgi:hypothetical protein